MCGNIAKNVQLAQSTISQHLKVFKDAGFIASNQGRFAG